MRFFYFLSIFKNILRKEFNFFIYYSNFKICNLKHLCISIFLKNVYNKQASTISQFKQLIIRFYIPNFPQFVDTHCLYIIVTCISCIFFSFIFICFVLQLFHNFYLNVSDLLIRSFSVNK